MKTNKLWLGLTGVATFLFALLLSVTILANNYAGYINDFLGLTGSGLSLQGSQYADEDGKLTDEGYNELIKDSYAFCIQEEEEGAVLLKNDNGALPLKDNERKVTLFGSNSAHTIYRSGAGGPAPNTELQIDMKKAFTDGGFQINETLYEAYQGVSGVSINSVNEAPISLYSGAIRNTFDSYKDAAIVTFARYGTENTDPPKGYMQITDNEKNLLDLINKSKKFTKIIVLLNGPLPMELGWLDDYNVDACLWFGNPGFYGLPGVVNILKGVDAEGNKVNPSGKTVETFASDTEGAPAMQNFGSYSFSNGIHYVVYKEGIYVGYKYYETRYEDKVLGQGNPGDYDYAKEVCFPFGYGLSYTSFTQKLTSVTYDAAKDTITAKGTVKNDGTLDGKSVVQIWAQTPYTAYDKTHGVEKPAVQVAAYTKVDVKAGETVDFEITFDRYLLASWDTDLDSNKGGYILEAGDYYFAVGNGAHEGLNNILGAKGTKTGLVDHLGAAYTPAADTAVKLTASDLGIHGDVDKDAYRYSRYNEGVEVKNQFPDADLNYWANPDEKVVYMTRSDWTGTFPTTVTSLTANERIVEGANMEVYKKPADAPKYSEGDKTLYNVTLPGGTVTFADMKDVPYDDPKWDEFVSQLTLDELLLSISDKRSLPGVAKINLPGSALVEGPEGLSPKFKYGDKRACTGFPTLPIVTASWDHAIQTEHGNRLGEEALFSDTAMVNAPGCNIIRTARSSRASEYMSEDGVLSYFSVSNIILAARTKGLIMNVKHCFLNEQETHRQGVATFCNEQAIREIYLKPFEGALTRGSSLGIMTSYNRIGLHYAATHDVLMNNVMRQEWAYKGSIIDDALGVSPGYCSTADMIHSGTDIFCLDDSHQANLKNIILTTDDGALLKDLQRANKRIFYTLLHSSMGGAVDETTVVATGDQWWQSLFVAIDVIVGVATVAAAGMFVFKTYFSKKNKQEDK